MFFLLVASCFYQAARQQQIFRLPQSLHQKLRSTMIDAVIEPEADHAMTQLQALIRNAQPTNMECKIADPFTTHLNANAIPILIKKLIFPVCRNWGMKNMIQRNAE